MNKVHENPRIIYPVQVKLEIYSPLLNKIMYTERTYEDKSYRENKNIRKL